MDADRQLRESDQERLRGRFYAGFDRSRLLSMLELDPKILDTKLEFLGEGTHFRAWRVPHTDLALKRAKPNFAPEGSPQRRQWTAATGLIKDLGGLIPPFEVLTSVTGALGLAMPYGSDPWAKASRHWQPLVARLAELAADLATRQLRLADVAQGRAANGVPFLIDLSDIVRR